MASIEQFHKTYNYEIQFNSEQSKDNVSVSDITLNYELGEINLFLVKPSKGTKFKGIHFIHWLETHASNSNRTQFLDMAKDLAKIGYLSVLPDCFWSLDKDDFEKHPRKYLDNWWSAMAFGKLDAKHDMKLISKQLNELSITENFLLEQDIDKSTVQLAGHDFGAMFGLLLNSLSKVYYKIGIMAFTSRFSNWFHFGLKEKTDLTEYKEELAFTDPFNFVNFDNKGFFLFGDDDFYVPKDDAEKMIEKSKAKYNFYSAKHGMNEIAYNDLKTWIMEL